MKTYIVHVKDSNSCDSDDEQRFNDLSESFINMIDAFDKEHHAELVELLKKYPADLNTGPGIGSEVLLEYFDLLKE